MFLLSIDPSSSSIGLALARVNGQSIDWLACRLVKDRKAGALGIVAKFDGALTEVLLYADPRASVTALIEIPSGRVDHRRNTGGGAGLSVYGFACGAVWQKLTADSRIASVECLPSDWMRGTSKEKRRRIALKAYPAYASISDPGCDISDAIAMGVWWALKNPTATGTA